MYPTTLKETSAPSAEHLAKTASCGPRTASADANSGSVSISLQVSLVHCHPALVADFLVAFARLDAPFRDVGELSTLLDIGAVAERLCVTERHVRRLVAERR